MKTQIKITGVDAMTAAVQSLGKTFAESFEPAFAAATEAAREATLAFNAFGYAWTPPRPPRPPRRRRRVASTPAPAPAATVPGRRRFDRRLGE